jgi:threonyl-tRNA synthetase
MPSRNERDEMQGSEYLQALRHSAAHVLATAMLEYIPEAKFAIGPAIDDGFYYDFELPRSLTPEDIDELNERMQRIIAADQPFDHATMPSSEAKAFFAARNQGYKVELIEDLERDAQVEDVSIYQNGDFIDLCEGPHVKSTGAVGAFKLLRTAGAYWRGDENRQQLQRVYGTAWKTPKELRKYLNFLEEAEKRDHRRLGRELDLFSFSDEIGPGLVIWHAKGGHIRSVMEDYWRESHRAGGYEFIYTPHIGKANLWRTSGHLNWFADNMYAPLEIDDQQYYLKPMNCPFHIQVYKSRTRSYRDLPLRYTEAGTVYRYERSGVLHGLLRVRGFTQDDAHLFCRPDQMSSELDRVLQFCLGILDTYGFKDLVLELSTWRPGESTKYAGEAQDWELAEAGLLDVLEGLDLKYKRMEGEAAFYGPKVDIKIVDVLGRPWQLSTIQFDFWLPQTFGLEYIGEDGAAHRPFMIHRALYGSIERFFGILLEHHGGAFPVWLAPVQAVVIPIADRHNEYAQEVAETLSQKDIRVEVDTRSERMNAKIRDAQLQKIPYMAVVGDREIEDGAVNVRLRTGKNRGAMPVADFSALILEQAASRSDTL